MNGAYSTFASVYDRLNPVVYSEWADYIENCFRKFGDEVRSVIDFGCGTGSMTSELARRGYIMTGIDIDSEMLSEADAHSFAEKLDIRWINADMRDFYAGHLSDAVICCLDGINHLTNRDDLADCFATVSRNLRQGGLFVFDLNTPLKFRTTLTRDFVIEDDGVMYIQQALMNKDCTSARFFITVFRENENGTWERTESEIKEKAWGLRTVKNTMNAAGLELIQISAGYDFNPPAENAERWYCVGRKL